MIFKLYLKILDGAAAFLAFIIGKLFPGDKGLSDQKHQWSMEEFREAIEFEAALHLIAHGQVVNQKVEGMRRLKKLIKKSA